MRAGRPGKTGTWESGGIGRRYLITEKKMLACLRGLHSYRG